MQYKADTVKEYMEQIPEERKKAIKKLRTVIKKNLPKGFKECIGYGMPAYVVPLSAYPEGYHCKADTPLPFISFASQKNFVALYHMGLYADESLMNWFVKEYPKHCDRKLDMGKSCIRFKKIEEIPFDLIGELISKMSMESWIALYEKNYKKK
jgi:uncharacterized protein YdhG (YjbR/CyaY superfamily)